MLWVVNSANYTSIKWLFVILWLCVLISYKIEKTVPPQPIVVWKVG